MHKVARLAGQFFGEHDFEFDVKIAPTIPPEPFDAFASQADGRGGLGAWPNFDGEITLKGGNRGLAAEEREGEWDFVVNKDVLPFAAEGFVGADGNGDVEF